MSRTRINVADVIAAQQAHRYAQNHARIRQVAASLPRFAAQTGEAGPKKQEPPSIGVNEGSTAPQSVLADGRAASAQCDRPG